MEEKVYIIGVGNDGRESLSPKAIALIEAADLLFGGERLLAFFPDVKAEKVPVTSKLEELVTQLKAHLGRRRMVILATGDPSFYGIARYLVKKLGKERFEILPNVSAMQWAFARIKESWDDAVLTSIHGRKGELERLVELVRRSRKIGIFTDEIHSPQAIARALLKAGIKGHKAYVCEDLLGPSEKITETDLQTLSGMEVSPLNTLILIKEEQESFAEEGAEALPFQPWTFGIPEDEFHYRQPKRGLITKVEVRVISLSKLRLKEESVVWDIGAGSGSVAIEAALLARRGLVYAIEKNEEDLELIRQNIEKFGARNVQVVHRIAPDGLDLLPDPDAVFVGGSGGFMRGILEVSAKRLKPSGRIVVNAITLENLHEAVSALKALGFEVEATLVQVARSKPLLGMFAFEALNPIYVIAGKRPGE